MLSFKMTFIANIERDCFIEYIVKRPEVSEAWELFGEHKFVKGMATGTLPLSAFKSCLVQDYLYLVRRDTSHC